MRPGTEPLHPSILEARQHVAEGRHEAAVQCLRDALPEATSMDQFQALAAVLVQTADACERVGADELALAACDAALTAVDWADIHARRGGLLARRGRRAEARAAYDRALGINPRFRAAAVERALLDAREGRLGEALETLTVLAAETPGTSSASFARGLDHLRHADLDQAAPLLRQALDPHDAWLEEQLRVYHLHTETGDRAAALTALRGAIAERPDYPDLQFLMGMQELAEGAVDDAIESLARALELHPHYHAARVELARALEAAGDTSQALQQVDWVLAIAPDHVAARALRERWTARRRGAVQAPEPRRAA